MVLWYGTTNLYNIQLGQDGKHYLQSFSHVDISHFAQADLCHIDNGIYSPPAYKTTVQAIHDMREENLQKLVRTL